MIRWLLVALFSSAAFAQAPNPPVFQSGDITPGHAVQWVTDGTVQDAGSGAGGSLTSLGVTGGPICVNSDVITNPYNALCLNAYTGSNAVISLQNYNGAPAETIVFSINGTIVPLGGGGGGTGTVTSVASGTNLTGGPITTSGTISVIPNPAFTSLNLNGSSSQQATIRSAATAGNITLTLPNTTGSNGQCLNTDGTGVLGWGACSGTGGGGTPGGSTTQVQYNLASAFAGSANMTFVSPTLTLGVAANTTGQLALASSVGSGKVVTLQALDTTTAWNFNLPTSAGTAGQPLLSGGGVSADMTFGTLGVAGGGTGAATLTANGVLIGNGTSAVTATALGASGTVLGGTGGAPTFAALVNAQVSASAAIAGTKLSFLNTASGGSTRTVTSKLEDSLSILDFGGDPTYTNDNSTAFNNALAAINTPGQCVYFPGGKYKFTAQVVYNFSSTPNSVCILGDGSEASVLQWTNVSGGLLFNLNTANQGIRVNRLSLLTTQNGGGTAIEVAQAAVLSDYSQSILNEVVISGATRPNTLTSTTGNYWTTGVAWQGLTGTNIINSLILGGGIGPGLGNGVVYLGGADAAHSSIYHYIANTTINSTVNAIKANANVQGIYVNEVNMQNGTNGMMLGDSSASGTGGSCPGSDNRTEFNIFNSQFFGTAAFVVAHCTTVPVGQITLIGNQVTVPASQIGVNITGGVFQVIQGNMFACVSTTGSIAIKSTSGTLANVNGNMINGCGIGIDFLVTSAYNLEYGNTITNTTTTVTDAQSGGSKVPFNTNGLITGTIATAAPNLGSIAGASGNGGIAIFGGPASATGDNGTTTMLNLVTSNATQVGRITRAAGAASIIVWPNAGTPGVNCSGTPDSSFTVIGGIVTAC